MRDLLPPLILSLKIALVATIVAAAVAIPLAWWIVHHPRFRGKAILEGLLLLPLVLPPTVVGYLIIMALGARGWLGQFVHRWFDYSIMFRFEGAVLAAAVVALPLLYLPAKAGFASVERELEDIARLFGANRLQLFWHVSLPLARRGLASGSILAFARAIGEFGATIMVFGRLSDNITLPIAIYEDYELGRWGHALPAVIVLSVMSLAMVMLFNKLAAKQEGS